MPRLASRKSENTQRVGDYVTGLWSGMNNTANTPSTGRSTDVRGVLLEILLAYHTMPKLSLALAALSVHMKFEREKR